MRSYIAPMWRRRRWRRWGRCWRRIRLFPKRVNIGFMQIVNREHVRLRVHERGVGETLACGSGTAAVVVGINSGDLSHGVTVELPGGRAVVAWPEPIPQCV
ncbi:MAG TPA: hypothetical protein VK110_08780 [Salinisphaeraceae bacterium]|nr:hypothetical protein [Salinisphaeraceae bacterium]